MAVIVAGGAGYIGSHTVRTLIENGADVAVIDNLSTGHKESLHPEARFYMGDLCDRVFLNRVFAEEKVEGVIHFAASSLVAESVRDPLGYYSNNCGGTHRLLTAMVEHGVDRLVFSSTAAVYGEPERIPVEEECSTAPESPYGETKLSIERMIGWVSGAHGLKYAALRYFNAAGALENGEIGEDHSPETHLIPKIAQVVNGKLDCLEIYGDDYPTPDGTCIRDYIHVCDLADAHVLALKYLSGGGESGAFNLGNGTGFSVKEVLDTAIRVSGREIASTMSARRPGDPARLVASAEKAEKLLKWQPVRSSLQNIIETAFKWHRLHPEGFRS